MKGMNVSGLSEMDIELDGIGHILSDNRLEVPRYQRSYAWTDKHVKDLFTDLADALQNDEPEYFLGSIVAIGTDTDRIEVVDGQQRLATVTILLAAIRDYFFKNGESERASDIEREYLARRDLRTQEVIPNLRLNELDNDFFAKRIVSRPDDPGRSIPPGTRES